MNPIIPNPDNLKNIIFQIKKDGYDKLFILSDFDRTLTYGSVNGIRTPSIMSMLRDGNHLGKDYAPKAHKLYDIYHPYEVNPDISYSVRKQKMQEWFSKANELMIRYGLTRADLVDIVKNGHIKFRRGVATFLDFLYQHQIPLIIVSASGCGETIELYLKKIKRNYPNIYYIINRLEWDKNGKAIKTKGELIHTMNKNEIIAQDPQVQSVVKNRHNIILLGDSVDDTDMAKAFNYSNLIKIGFLIPQYYSISTAYEKNFDVILKGDGGFNKINKLIKSLS